MKFLNPDYINCIKKYLDEEGNCTDVKIIGKIYFDKSYINCSINDTDIGIIISGYVIEKESKTTGSKKKIPTIQKIPIKVIKEKDNNKIYRKDSEIESSREINELQGTLMASHIILYKFDKNSFIGKKRNPDILFFDEINKRKKY